MKTIIGALFVALSLLPPVSAATQAQADITVTLLGTGAPQPSIDRFGPATLVEAGQEKLLFDCGRGATQRLGQRHISLSALTAVFLTHLHSDHVVGLPDLWLTGWLPTPFGHRTTPLRVWGPTGTRQMAAGLEQAYRADIRIRHDGEGLLLQGVAIQASDIAQGVVYLAQAPNGGPVAVTIRCSRSAATRAEQRKRFSALVTIAQWHHPFPFRTRK